MQCANRRLAVRFLYDVDCAPCRALHLYNICTGCQVRPFWSTLRPTPRAHDTDYCWDGSLVQDEEQRIQMCKYPDQPLIKHSI